MKTFLIVAVVYFLILYFVAFVSNMDNRDSDDILWISRSQWGGIFALWLPIVLLMLGD